MFLVQLRVANLEGEQPAAAAAATAVTSYEGAVLIFCQAALSKAGADAKRAKRNKGQLARAAGVQHRQNEPHTETPYRGSDCRWKTRGRRRCAVLLKLCVNAAVLGARDVASWRCGEYRRSKEVRDKLYGAEASRSKRLFELRSLVYRAPHYESDEASIELKLLKIKSVLSAVPKL